MTELASQSNYFDSDFNRDLLSITGFFSVLLHAVLILAVTFKFPEIGTQVSTDNTLEFILLSRNNERSVDDADLVSDTDNLGGGPDDEKGSTNEIYKPVDPSPVNTVEKSSTQSLENSLTPDQFIAAQTSSVSIVEETPEETKLRNRQRSIGEDLVNTNARQLERERRLAELRRKQKEYAERPRKKFHSPTTKASGAAKYLHAWREKLEKIGNTNYPIQIKANKLSGSLTVTVEILKTGFIESISIE